ncbi:MAG: hypothetical protein J6T64_06470 [Bacteroidaceae bacterium]|nr:hypothetical protein [Bacteroidaceae bacterium]
MTESEIYRSLGMLTKHKERWEESLPYVASLLTPDSVKVKAKALCNANLCSSSSA